MTESWLSIKTAEVLVALARSSTSRPEVLGRVSELEATLGDDKREYLAERAKAKEQEEARLVVVDDIREVLEKLNQLIGA